MSKKQEYTIEDLRNSAIGVVVIFVFVAWLVDWGPFGWFDGPEEAAATEPSAPKQMYVKKGGGWCDAEWAAKELVRAAQRQDLDTISRLNVEGHCEPIPANLPVTHVEGISIVLVRDSNGDLHWTGSGAIFYQ